VIKIGVLIEYNYKIGDDIISKLKVLSLFSGIGAFEKALENIGFKYDLVGYSEINDGYGKALQDTYELLHSAKNKYLGLVQDIHGGELGHVDLITHGSPCQNFSMAGTKEGGDKGSGTQSSLMWETVRIVGETKPKFVIWENVKGVLYKGNIENFNKYIDKMNDLGYTSHHNVLIGSDYGVPQRRERIFVVSVLDDNNGFNFPDATNTNKVLRDILEIDVDEKYNVPVSMIRGWINKKPPFGDRFNLLQYNNVGYTLVAKGGRAVITNNYILKNECDYSLINEFKGKPALQQIIDNNIELRALTPREYWRMMGWDEQSIDKVIELGISEARMYKMVGNSIVVPIIEELFKSIFNQFENVMLARV